MEQKKQMWKHVIVVSTTLERVPVSLDIKSLRNAFQVAYDLKHESWLDDNTNNVNNVFSSSIVGPAALRFRDRVLQW